MKENFFLDGIMYTVTPCTAIASRDLDAAELLVHDGADRTNSPFRQNALLVENTADSGEKIQKVVFGYEMPETDKAFADMCEDSAAWESDYEVLDTVWTDPNTNRQIVQEGLDARAAARADAAQEAQDDLFLDELNEMTKASRDMTARLEAAQRRRRKELRDERREKRQAEAEDARRDTFMQRIFTAVCIMAAAIWLYTIEAVVLWLAATIAVIALLYIIVNTAGYYTRDKRKEN